VIATELFDLHAAGFSSRTGLATGACPHWVGCHNWMIPDNPGLGLLILAELELTVLSSLPAGALDVRPRSISRENR